MSDPLYHDLPSLGKTWDDLLYDALARVQDGVREAENILLEMSYRGERPYFAAMESVIAANAASSLRLMQDFLDPKRRDG